MAFLSGSDDLELLARIQGGSDDALAAFYDRHYRAGFALAMRVVGDPSAAEEVLQEAFLSVWRRASTFRGEAGTPRNWFLGIVHHRAIDRIRALRRTPPRVPLDGSFTVGDSEGVLPQVAALLERSEIREAVDALPGDQREAIDLAYFGGFTCREIAERTGAPVGTVKSRMRLGLNRLRAALSARRDEAAKP
jgi:RNA polymerase sigma-70 factor (ECF subfamily)